MAKVIILLLLLATWNQLMAQEERETDLYGAWEDRYQEQSELLEQEEDVQDRLYWLQRKLALNRCSEGDLAALEILDPLQLEQFFLYKEQLGDLTSIYELQAIPHFDLFTIQRLLPYVKVGDDFEAYYSWKELFTKGNANITLRLGRTFPKARGFIAEDSISPHYRGDPFKSMLRFRYQLGGYASLNLLVEKDAGEQFIRSGKPDFSSFHLMIGKKGVLKQLIIGDYLVCLGQGLMQWQGMPAGKGNDLLSIKKSSAVLKPYTSPGEFYFYRGAAMTLGKRGYSLTTFFSRRKLDAIMEQDSSAGWRSSIQKTGYHRTILELEREKKLRQITAGASLSYHKRSLFVQANYLLERSATPFKAGNALYQYFKDTSARSQHLGISYQWNFRNLFAYGEYVYMRPGASAFINTCMLSFHAKLQAAILFRSYTPSYTAPHARAFGAQSTVSNETGFYMGLQYQFNKRVKISAYMDLYKFPWLKYRLSIPGAVGTDHMIVFLYQPSKAFMLRCRYKERSFMQDVTSAAHLKEISRFKQGQVRIESSWAWSPAFIMKQRMEVVNLIAANGTKQESWLGYGELRYKQGKLQVQYRFTCYETTEGGSNLYLTQGSSIFNNSLQQFNGRGVQHYLSGSYKINKKVQVWCALQQGKMTDGEGSGSGWDLVPGRNRWTVQWQLKWVL
ncbi:hypothetical protein COR50_00745 [Chitinophaga caeni]|uniref:Helix-hairpin-helix DNA-binding motif class 1 domain-containing protein n=1 Tax=Chitinophaga caeni TaxID=2029983 RepID=A0A291QPI6_9BACT|nr:hypothetical protein [Chitinophaga caeni]ATL45803.1 hypothetical protein COR50_00745 [Chitinophaga caeni]